MMLQAPLRELLDRPPGERRLGPFRLVAQLGSGGFAPVWRADEVYGETSLRTAAIKLFAVPTGPEGQVQRQRVIEEARRLCQVEHPNVVRFYSLQADEVSGVVGLAMEFVAGRSLDRILQEKGQLSPREAVAVGLSVASALAAVHRAGLVHRDVKPANVIEAAGVTKLIDFGIAAADARGAPKATKAPRQVVIDDIPIEVGTKMSHLASVAADSDGMGPWWSGTLGYIDPGCLADPDRAPTPASDLYGLGALLFECLSGKLPAAAGAGQGLRSEILDGRAPAPPLASLCPDAPEGLAQLVDALLLADPDARPRSTDAVVRALEQLRAGLVGRQRRLPPEEIGPFRGLGSFGPSDRDIFFGRAADVAGALELLRSRGLTALVGASGTGKSSLARAGVIPAILDGALGQGLERWVVAATAPGSDPFRAITEALAPVLPRHTQIPPVPERVVELLAEQAAATSCGILLLLDQLEEVFSLADEAGRLWTARLLAAMAERPRPGVRALVTLRQDALDVATAMEGLGPALLRGAYVVAPLSPMAWADAIDAAFAAYGYRLEDKELGLSLVAELKNTGTPMPLVQFALAQLWNGRDQERKLITRAAYTALGGLAGALDRHAEATRAVLLGEDPSLRGLLFTVVMALTSPGGSRITAPVAVLRGVGPADRVERILQVLEAARLIERQGDGVTLAHDALLTQWSRLRGWMLQSHEDRSLAEELEADASRWLRERQDAALLWRGYRAAMAEELCRRSTVQLSEQGQRFVSASVRQERSHQRWRGGTVGGAAALLLAATLAFLWARDARRERQFSEQNVAEISRLSGELVGAYRALQAARNEAAITRLDADGARAQVALLEQQIQRLHERIEATATPEQWLHLRAAVEAERRRAEERRQMRCLPGDPLCPP